MLITALLNAGQFFITIWNSQKAIDEKSFELSLFLFEEKTVQPNKYEIDILAQINDEKTNTENYKHKKKYRRETVNFRTQINIDKV